MTVSGPERHTKESPEKECVTGTSLDFKIEYGRSRCGAAETNPTRNHEVAGSIPGLAQGVKDPVFAMSCGVGHRHGSDLVVLLWPWCRPVAAALI